MTPLVRVGRVRIEVRLCWSKIPGTNSSESPSGTCDLYAFCRTPLNFVVHGENHPERAVAAHILVLFSAFAGERFNHWADIGGTLKSKCLESRRSSGRLTTTEVRGDKWSPVTGMAST